MIIEPLQRGLIQLRLGLRRYHLTERLKEGLDNDAELKRALESRKTGYHRARYATLLYKRLWSKFWKYL